MHRLRLLLPLLLVGAIAALDVPVLRVPRATTAPAVDAAPVAGAVWSQAAVVARLGSSIGQETSNPPLATSVRLLWDETFLYLRFECEDADIFAPFAERDGKLYQGDVAELFLDPVGDARQWFEVEVAPNGAVLDANHLLCVPAKGTPAGRLDWDLVARELWSFPGYDLPGLRTAAQKREGGWVAEMAVPAAAAAQRLGTKTWVAGQRLRGNLVRYDRAPAAADGSRAMRSWDWGPVEPGCPHISPLAMGVLELAP